MKPNTKLTVNINGLFYYSGLGNKYYYLVIPVIALFFSENIQQLKLTFIVFFSIMAVLQLVPEILTQRVGFRRAILIYFLVFLAGTLLGYFYDGRFWIIVVSRSLQAVGLSVFSLLSRVLAYYRKEVLSFVKARIILSGLSGPLIVLFCGVLLHFYSWRICYLFISCLYLIGLVWVFFNFHDSDFEIKKEKVSIKTQITNTFSVLRHVQLVLLLLCSTMVTTIMVFIFSIYGFVYLHDFHAEVYYVSLIPLGFYLAALFALCFSRLKNRFSEHKILVMCLCLLVLVSLIFLLCSTLTDISPIFVVLLWVILLFIVSVYYLFSSDILSTYSKQLNVVVQCNTLYCFLKNMLPVFVLLVWTHFSKYSNINMVGEILVFLSVLGLVFLVFFVFHRPPTSSMQE